jgi:hypothetical protein
MSGRPKKKQTRPDESGGRSHYSRDFPALESPQRLAGTKKRSGPRSPAFKNPRPPDKEVDGFEGQPLQSRVLNYDAAPFVPGASSGAPSQAGGNARSSRQVEFNSPSNRYYELSAQSDDEDTEDSGSASSTSRTEDAVGLGVDASPPRPPRQVVAVDLTEETANCSEDDASASSFDFYKSIDLSRPPYQDLIPFSSKIKWRTDGEGVKWPRYDKLTVRSIKVVMAGRGLNVQGLRKDLVRRLERDDRKRFTARGVLSRDYSQPKSPDGRATDDEINKFMEEIASKSKASKSRSSTTPKDPFPGDPEDRSASHRSNKATASRAAPSYEEVTSEDSEAMTVDQDAEDLFPESSPHSPARPKAPGNDSRPPPSRSDYSSVKHGSDEVQSKFFFQQCPEGYEFSEVDDLTNKFACIFDELADYLTILYHSRSITMEDRRKLCPSNGMFTVVSRDGRVLVENSGGDVVAVVPQSLIDMVEVEPPPLSDDPLPSKAKQRRRSISQSKSRRSPTRRPMSTSPSGASRSRSKPRATPADRSRDSNRGNPSPIRGRSESRPNRQHDARNDRSKTPAPPTNIPKRSNSTSSRRKAHADELLARETAAAADSYENMDVDKYDGDCNLSAEQRRATSDTNEASNSYAAALKRNQDKDKGSDHPPETIATASTVSTAQSTLTSLRTPSTASSKTSQRSTTSGKLLNTRPRRVVERDGVANFVSISVAPSRAKKVNPSANAYQCLVGAFTAMKKCDPETEWFPIYDSEPGDDIIPSIKEIKDFPADL